MCGDLTARLEGAAAAVVRLEEANGRLRGELGAAQGEVARLCEQRDALQSTRHDVLSFAQQVQLENRELVGQLIQAPARTHPSIPATATASGVASAVSVGGRVCVATLRPASPPLPPLASALSAQPALQQPSTPTEPSSSASLSSSAQAFNQARKKWDTVTK